MIIKYQKLIALPVITEAGQLLGKITKIDIETDSQIIHNYYIKSANIVKGLFEGELIINSKQVINITNDRIIVENRVFENQKKKAFNLKTTERKTVVN